MLAQSPDLDWVPPRTGIATAVPPPPLSPDVAGAEPAGPGELAVAPFVGRAGELAALAAAADRACEPAAGGHVVPVLVAGDPGEGKTALLEAAARARAAAGWAVAWGRCPEVEGAPPAWPWAELLRGLAQRVPPDPELAQTLAPLLDDGAARPTGPDAVAQRFYLHRAVGRYLAAVSESAPLLVVVDDVHRADPESLDLLTAVADVVESHRVVLVAAYRGRRGRPRPHCGAGSAGPARAGPAAARRPGRR